MGAQYIALVPVSQFIPPDALAKATGLKADAISRAALSQPEALARLAQAQNEEGFWAT